MAEWPRENFPPGMGSDSTGPQYTANINFPENSHGVPNMGMYQPPNFMPTFVPPDRPPPALPSGFPEAAAVHNSSGNFFPRAPPYTAAPPWPSSGDPQRLDLNYLLGGQHVGVLPPENPGGVVAIDTSVPPPQHPRFPAPPTFQPPAPYCGPLDSVASQAEAPGPLKENDQEWIDSWIRQLPRRPTSFPVSYSCAGSKVKVWKVKQTLGNCRAVLRALEKLEKELAEGCEVMEEAEWNQKLAEAETKEVILRESLGELDEGVLESMKRVLCKRSSKRARQRGRRVLDREMATARAERRRRLHLEADMWLEGMQAQVDLQRREEMLKQEADGVLWEVRRKQSEGRRILSLLSALVKLYQVRVKKRDLASNPAVSENEDQFQNIIDKLSSLWERQMSEYEVEERALRVMLTDSPEGSGSTEAKSRAVRAVGDLQRSLRQWETALFGGGSSGAMSEELLRVGADSCQWLYLQPSKSLDALVENRRHWDQFISTSPSASTIPAGWVVPAEASSEDWKALTVTRGECG